MAAVLSAGLFVLSSPGTVSWRWAGLVAWVGFVPLVAWIPRVSVRTAGWMGLLTGTLVTLGACSWYPGLVARFAGIHPVLAVGIGTLIALWQGTGWALLAMLMKTLVGTRPGRSAVFPMLVAGAGFVLVERCFPTVFPWSIGITQYRFPRIAQAAELGGPSVLSFLMVVLAGAVVWLRNRTAMFTVGASLVLVLGAGSLRLASFQARSGAGQPLRIAAVQAGQTFEGWSQPALGPTESSKTLEQYQELTAQLEKAQGRVDLVIWPEKAYPKLIRRDAVHDYPAHHPGRVRKGFASPVLFGLTSVDAKTKQVWNSVALLGVEGNLRVVYDKVNLIFYSEGLPGWLRGTLPGGRRYQQGDSTAPVTVQLADGPPTRLGVFICFESTFPSHVRRLVQDGAEILVNLSDDAWFGDSTEPEQHLAMAVFRAVESRRDLIRATGSGISAIITAAGEIEKRSEINKPSAMVGVVHRVDATSAYQVLGDTFLVLCGLAVLGACGRLVSQRLDGLGRSRAPSTKES